MLWCVLHTGHCKINLEVFYNMFSSSGTAIESAAIINSGKAVVIQE